MRNLIKLILAGILIPAFFLNQAEGQVVINSAVSNPTADGSAVLELQSTDMGFLVPKVTLSALNDASPVTAPATGLLVYNTGGAVIEGFYFWANGLWNEVINDKRVFANEQFGELYENAPSGTPTLVELVNNTLWYGWISASEGTLSTGITSDTVNVIADKMNLSRYGLYKIELCLSIGGTQNQQVTSSVFIVRPGVGDIETRIKTFSKVSSAGDLISGSSMGVLELFPGDQLDLRFTSTNNNEDLFIYSINLIVTKVGE